jgi:hypothetical protein
MRFKLGYQDNICLAKQNTSCQTTCQVFFSKLSPPIPGTGKDATAANCEFEKGRSAQTNLDKNCEHPLL